MDYNRIPRSVFIEYLFHFQLFCAVESMVRQLTHFSTVTSKLGLRSKLIRSDNIYIFQQTRKTNKSNCAELYHGIKRTEYDQDLNSAKLDIQCFTYTLYWR